MFLRKCIFKIIFCFVYTINGSIIEALVSTRSLLPCPTTRWSSLPADEKQKQQQRSVPFLKTITKPRNTTTTDEELAWLRCRGDELMDLLGEHGALYFRDFDLPKTKEGFRMFCDDALPLMACEDALASIGVRKLLSATDGVYRAVDSDSLAETFIGLHNDCTHALAPPFAAFGCFVSAKRGGAFLLADGREILRRLNPRLISKMIQRGVRVRVAALPTPFLCIDDPTTNKTTNGKHIGGNAGSMIHKRLSELLKTIVRWGLGTFLPKLGLELAYTDDYSMLQILEPLKSPINVHPLLSSSDKAATFFSGIHSQSAYLQKKRAAADNAFQKGVAVTDVFYGETTNPSSTTAAPMLLETIEANVLDHIEDVMNQNTKRVLMKPGDVVLLDSYQVLHGRDTFTGPREHGVVWLTNENYSSEEAKGKKQRKKV